MNNSCVENVLLFNMSHAVSVCPAGYLFKDGYVPGIGLIGEYSASMDKCKNACDVRSDCNSFIYSPENQVCFLYPEMEPTKEGVQGYHFCSKSRFLYWWRVRILLNNLLYQQFISLVQ